MTTDYELAGDAPVALYRLFDATGELLYVGITADLRARFATHAQVKSWWPQVAQKIVTWHPNREVAQAAEAQAIQAEDPLHNIVGKVRHVRAGNRHKTNPIPFRPKIDGQRERLLTYAKEHGMTVNAVIRAGVDAIVGPADDGYVVVAG